MLWPGFCTWFQGLRNTTYERGPCISLAIPFFYFMKVLCLVGRGGHDKPILVVVLSFAPIEIHAASSFFGKITTTGISVVAHSSGDSNPQVTAVEPSRKCSE